MDSTEPAILTSQDTDMPVPMETPKEANKKSERAIPEVFEKALSELTDKTEHAEN